MRAVRSVQPTIDERARQINQVTDYGKIGYD